MKIDLSKPPVAQNGLCHYIAARFRASPSDRKRVRDLVRGKPIAVLYAGDVLDLVMFFASPIEARDGLLLAETLASAIGLPVLSVAPSAADEPQWEARPLSEREKIRVELAVGGAIDIYTIPGASRVDRRIAPVLVRNSAMTMTYVGGT